MKPRVYGILGILAVLAVGAALLKGARYSLLGTIAWASASWDYAILWRIRARGAATVCVHLESTQYYASYHTFSLIVCCSKQEGWFKYNLTQRAGRHTTTTPECI